MNAIEGTFKPGKSESARCQLSARALSIVVLFCWLYGTLIEGDS
jgi:hypothetical protein